jgi:hypothetical protein
MSGITVDYHKYACESFFKGNGRVRQSVLSVAVGIFRHNPGAPHHGILFSFQD